MKLLRSVSGTLQQAGHDVTVACLPMKDLFLLGLVTVCPLTNWNTRVIKNTHH